MSEADYIALQNEYCNTLKILRKLNTHLAILDKPLIAVSTCARRLADQLENASSESLLPKRDKKAIQAYVDDARSYCVSYFEEDSCNSLPGICLLRLPCDSHDLVKAHKGLVQEYLELRADLGLKSRNLEATRHAMREPTPT